MIKILDFCILKFYDNYVISIINEGIHLTVELTNIMSEIALNYYKGNSFVYISHRVNNYSVDTDGYIEISKMKTLAGFVVVSNEKSSIKNALLEKVFIEKPFQIFSNIEDAILWANNIRKMDGRDFSIQKGD